MNSINYRAVNLFLDDAHRLGGDTLLGWEPNRYSAETGDIDSLVAKVVRAAKDLSSTSLVWLKGHSFASFGLPEEAVAEIHLSMARELLKQNTFEHIGYYSYETEKKAWTCFKSWLPQTKNREAQLQLALILLPMIHQTLNKTIDSLGFDEKARIEIALKGASFESESVSRNIWRFHIQDENIRFEIAKICQKNNPENVSKYLDDFQFKEEKKLIDLALSPDAKNDKEFFQNFQNYKLRHESVRVQAVLHHMGGYIDRLLCERLSNCDIMDRNDRFEIAKKIEPSILCQYLRRFDLTEEQYFYLLKNGAKTTKDVRFSIDLISKESDRAEIYRELLLGNDNLGYCLPDFQIQTAETLLSLAEIDAKKNNYSYPFMSRINLYGKLTPKDRLRLLRMAASHGNFDPHYLGNFPLDSSEEKDRIFACYFVRSPEEIPNSRHIPPPLLKKLSSELSGFKIRGIDEPFLQTRSKPFRALYEKLREQGQGQLLCRSLLKTELRLKIVASTLSLSKEEVGALEELALALNETWSLEEREYFSKEIFLHLLDRENFDLWYRSLPRMKTPMKEVALVKHCLVPSACFSLFSPEKGLYQTWVHQLQSKGRVFRDGKKAKIMMGLFYQAHQKIEQGKTVVGQLFWKDEEPHLRSILLSALLHFGRPPQMPLSLDPLKKMRRKVFFEECNLPPTVSPDAVEALFESWRDPQVIPTYLAKIGTVSEKEALKQCFTSWLTSVLSGSHSEWRKGSPHRKKLAELGVSEALFKDWEMERPAIDFDLIGNPDQNEPLEKRFLKFLKVKLLTDHHLPNVASTFPHLYAYLLKSTPDHLTAQEQKLQSSQQDELTAIERLFFRLFRKGNLQLVSELCENIEKEAVHHPDFSQFLSDLKELRQKLIGQTKNKDKNYRFVIYDTEDSQDLFVIGKETGGCQNPYGNSEYCKCLLGYQDWKNRAIVVKNPFTGEVVARRMVRLLWNQKTNRPSLFIERCYSLFPDDRLDKEIQKYAVRLAKSLKLDLFHDTHGDQESELVSFGSLAPLEYTDAGGGTTDGSFTVKKATPLLYSDVFK